METQSQEGQYETTEIIAETLARKCPPFTTSGLNGRLPTGARHPLAVCLDNRNGSKYRCDPGGTCFRVHHYLVIDFGERITFRMACLILMCPLLKRPVRKSQRHVILTRQSYMESSRTRFQSFALQARHHQL